MRNRYFVVTAVSFLSVCLIASLVRSQDKPATPADAAATPAPGDAAAPAAATDSQATADKQAPSAEEMMKAWEKYGQPGKEHEIFKSIEGKFDADVTLQMPGAPSAEKSTGVAENKSIFDGRYLGGEFTGTMMGKAFQGKGLWAYDKLKETYVNLWIDDMSTMVMISEGKADSSGKVITLSSTCPDPIEKKDKTIKSVLTVIDNDNHTYEAFEPGPSGSEIRTLSIKYTRVK
jgi:hypothetical protein